MKDGANNISEFPCGRWLSVSEDDGQISRDLVLQGADTDGVAGIKILSILQKLSTVDMSYELTENVDLLTKK